ncbi:MAG: nucleotidyltransferase domain-containing protein [Clostridiales bacterium]|nr:nucleotidyltransferase domain-containing protein [Clostridiales bacterium]
MNNTIEKFQKAFQSSLKTLKRNKKVLSILTFGSVVSGDVWEESDIDLFVIYDNDFNEIRDVYSLIQKVPVHTRIISKNKLLEMYESEEKKSYIINILSKSKLVYCKDDEITNTYNKSRYAMDSQVLNYNLVFLGDLLKNLGVCKKYLNTGGLNTAYEVLVKSLDSLSKLYININGYSVTKDSVAMAANLNIDIKKIVDNLFEKKISESLIEETIFSIERYLDENIIVASNLLLDYLHEQIDYVSCYEILNDNTFKNYNIKMEYILRDLVKRKIIQVDKRQLMDSEGNKIINENVYLFNNKNS